MQLARVEVEVVAEVKVEITNSMFIFNMRNFGHDNASTA